MKNYTHTTIPVRTLASGQILNIDVFRFEGDPSVPSAYIQSGMHGAELQGTAVIDFLIRFFTDHPPKGTVTLVPAANPYALNNKTGEYTQGRFDPTYGDNWNRLYWDALNNEDGIDIENLVKTIRSDAQNSIQKILRHELIRKLEQQLQKPLTEMGYGRKLALTLQRMAVEADSVLDLHCASHSVRHVYAPEYARQTVRYLNIPYVLFIPNLFAGAMDEAVFCPWWTLSQKLSVPCPVEAYTIELGNQEAYSAKDAHGDAMGIINYLVQRGTCDPIKPKGRDSAESIFACRLQDYKTIFSPTGGLCEFSTVTGGIVPAQEPLAVILTKAGNEKISVALPYDCIPIVQYSSAALHQGVELLKVFSKWEVM
ncbi:MAG TPA: succinylglutamate desuccinylase/aspartoacylase family protein [bacterium]|nr:succinylglutamate desuccinylase/aspartoacylase family protein [bacterium]HNM15435.1 succinylglutamate desuccinylase/aspartoacylase family protein [bacterium]HNO90373.1 succinylglutamate desuccinylase/aspartoacylase family protein [bacterium]